MTVQQRFNDLNGSEVSREVLENIITAAKDENNTEVVYRLSKILLDNPNSEEFFVELQQYSTSLNAPRYKGAFKDALTTTGRLKKGWKFEKGTVFKVPVLEKKKKRIIKPRLPGKNKKNEPTIKDFKALGIPFIENPETVEDNFYSLGVPFSTDDIYKMITDKMVGLVKNATGHGYKKKWGDYEYYEKEGFLIPFNFITKNQYRGVNHWMLKQNDLFSVFDNPYFLTFKQVKDKGGVLKKGSKGKPVIYFTILYKYENKAKNIDFGTYDKKKMVAFLKKRGVAVDQFKTLPIIKYYNVFNGADIDDIDFKLENIKIGKVLKSDDSKKHKRNEQAELIVTHLPKPAPPIKHGGGKAFYRVGADSIQMPRFNSFDTPNDYYRTLFHEIVHSTGDPLRLNRDFSGKFGSKNYAKEELIAEFGAVFLSAQAGIIWHSNKNHAEYLKSWSNVLKIAADDTRFLMRAASAAQKATDFALNLNQSGEPAFYKDLHKIVKDNSEQLKLALAGAAHAEEIIKMDINNQVPNPIKIEVIPDPIQIEDKTIIEESLGNPLIDKSSLAYKLSNRQNRVTEYYNIAENDISEFLGKIEKKEKESVVITVTGGQGSMKTRYAFRVMNALGKNYKVGHASIEEHPESTLYWNKVHEYISEEALKNISNPEISNIQELDALIKANDVIIIDSFAKMQELEKGFEVDKDLRKKYDGKLFLVIFQQTSDGKMRGGTKSQYDADIVLFTEKFDDYEQNFVYADKNRYQNKNLSDLKYNIFRGKLNSIQPIVEEKEVISV